MLNEPKEKTNIEGGAGEGSRIYLQVEKPREDAVELDLVNVASHMGKRRRLYGYLLAIGVLAGVFAGLLMTGVGQMMGGSSYAEAVVTFQYEGIEEGLDPNGASFDVNKIKSPAVIEEALTELGIDDIGVESVRRNLTINGVIPEDAIERITVLEEMAEEDVSNYEKILDVSYFPSQYVVSLYQARGMSPGETRELLDAILESYKAYFMDTYANTAVLTVTGNLIEYEDYDYGEAVDMIRSQIDIMQDYVEERLKQAPDFRSANTGLSFGDILTSLGTIESIDMANLSSYIENNVLTKDRQRQIEYYTYKIKDYSMELSELQAQLTTVQNTLDNYAKDPIVIVSSQESTQEITQTNEYYDTLVQKKLELSEQISEVNTRLNDTYTKLENVSSSSKQNVQAEYDRADEMLERLTGTLSEWSGLIEETTQEYYTTTLFSNAVKVAVPAQYKAAGDTMYAIKRILLCMTVAVLVITAVWCVDGIRVEFVDMRRRRKEE